MRGNWTNLGPEATTWAKTGEARASSGSRSRTSSQFSVAINVLGAPFHAFEKHVILTSLCKIEENDDGRIADGGVMAGEVEAAGFSVHMEHGDVVTSLIAAIEELPGGVEVEAARIVPACPFFPDIREQSAK